MTFKPSLADRPSNSQTTKPKSRRQHLVEALERAQRPKPLGGKPIENPEQLTPLQLAGEVVRREREPVIGGMTKLLYSLSAEDQKIVRQVANEYENQRELGRWGDPKKILVKYGVDADIAEVVADALANDYVAAQLIRRRRKGNRDLELPPLTRKDHASAAYDAHGFSDEDD